MLWVLSDTLDSLTLLSRFICKNLLLISVDNLRKSFHSINIVWTLAEILSIFWMLSLIESYESFIIFVASFISGTSSINLFSASFFSWLSSSNISLFDLNSFIKSFIKFSNITFTSSIILNFIRYKISLFCSSILVWI